MNVAATCTGTRALGPGLRSVVWVQGCPFDCAGCIAPEWIPQRPARTVDVDRLATELLTDPLVTGLTLSGGEPMAQAPALGELVREIRRRRDVDVVCFTGFRLAELRRRPDTAALLGLIDVLIDGRYVAARNDFRGLRGSSNQQVHHLTGRLRDVGYDFAGRTRNAEIHLDGNEALLVGVPPAGVLEAFDRLTTRKEAR
ncbi:4Fe-4S single cluster domain-containing protein [Actinoplanes sp. NPDC026670]|uniref:4Fe-4S single cluster domain-containing protein n=1 Tax=Actinoplanes sp. NPDC026670 TaxID=3154700 RepID=UPI0033FEDDC6